MKKYNSGSLKCIELFAGCGGLALGLLQSGWHGIFAIEKDPMAFETLSQNMLRESSQYRGFASWPDWLPKTNHDIKSLLSNKLFRKMLSDLRGSVDLVAGGPPCQGFSVGGRRDGADERNSLVFSMLDIVELVEPKIVFIENVEGIGKKFVARPGASSTSVADEVVVQLDLLGYTSTYHLLDARKFGVPQARFRMGIVGVKACRLSSESLRESFIKLLDDCALLVRKAWGLPLGKEITAKEALHDLTGADRVICPDSHKFESTVYTPATSEYAKAMRKNSKDGETPNSHRFSKHGERILELYNLAHDTQPPGRLSKSFLVANGTQKDKKVLIDPNAPVSTITTHPDEFIHYEDSRNITVREMARLQSFPDDFHFFGRYTINGERRKIDVARCSQVGNAVPPLMGQGIGLVLKELAKYSGKE